MSSALKKRATVLVCVPALLGLTLGLGPAVAAAATEDTPLTPELATLAEPAVAGAPEAQQAEAIDLPVEGPGSLVREGDEVVVEAHFEKGALARTAALEAAGATVLAASGRYQTVALSIAPEDLEALAEVPGLEAVAPSLEPVFYGLEEEAGTSAAGGTTSATSNGLCEGGSVISEAMTQLHVAGAREASGARGEGMTIGVLSDSFDTATEAIEGGAVATHADDDEVSNDLPGPASTCSGQQVPVRVVAEGPAGSTDEGRAMLQVIHDLAPHAELAFATAYSTELEFAENIERLAAPVSAGGGGADVIVDDVAYFAEPFFQEGPVANAVRKVTSEGVVYLTAAGNDNLIESGTGNEFASWERSEFHDTTCPSTLNSRTKEAASNCMNFSPSGTDATYGITVAGRSTLIVDLQWAEAWYGVQSDLNAYLLNSSGQVITSEPTRNVGSGSEPKPMEVLGWENTSTKATEVRLVIDRCIHNCNSAASVSAEPRLKVALMENGSGVSKTEYPTSNETAGIVVGPTVFGHAGSASAITLGAVRYTQSATAPAEPEYYSSRGPVTHYFGPVDGTTAAAALSTPEVVQKPNLTATDCASTTFFATYSSGWHFCGTSEAGPHAAAVAALMEQTEPLATPDSIVAAMEGSATAFTEVTAPAAVGAGMLNAEAAIAAIGGTPVDDPASTVVGAVEGSATATTTAGSAGTTGTSTGSSSGASVDKSRPTVRIAAHPKALERTRKRSIVGRFRFASDESNVTFYCRIDGTAQRRCGERFRGRFSIGRHVVRVRAVDSAGNSSSGTSVFRFRVEQVGG